MPTRPIFFRAQPPGKGGVAPLCVSSRRVTAATAASSTTFSAGLSTNDWTFSNGNLTANRSANNNFHAIARGSQTQTSGFFVATVDAQPGGGLGVGFDDGTTSGTNPGATSTSIAYLQDGSIWYNGGINQSGLATYTAADAITATKSGGNVTFKKNGVTQGSAIDVSGTLTNVYPLVYASTAASVGTQFTSDFSGWGAVASTTVVVPFIYNLRLTGYQPPLSFELTAAPGHLVLGGKTPTIGISVSPAKGSLVLAGHQPTVALAVSPATGHITLGGLIPSVARTTAVAPSTGHLTLGGKMPAVSLTSAVAPAKGALLLTGRQPSIAAAGGLAPNVGHLVLSGKQPSIVLNTGVTPGTGHIGLGGKVPALALLLSSSTAHLSLGGKVPIVGVGRYLSPRTGHQGFHGKRPEVHAIVWHPEADATGTWADEAHSGTWAPAPANEAAWAVETEPTGTWTDEPLDAANWS